MILLVFNLLLAFVWVAITGSASFINLVFGFFLAALALAIVRSSYGGTLYLGRIRRILALLLLFISELAKSAGGRRCGHEPDDGCEAGISPSP